MIPAKSRMLQAVLAWLFSGTVVTSWLGNIGLLVGRIYLGLTICKAGASKFPTANWFQDQVAGLGIPVSATMAFLASAAEFVGGALLIVGLCTRPAAFFAGATMGVATFVFHKNYLGEMHIAQLYFWMFVVFFCTGGGSLSIDALLRRRLESDATPPGNSARMAALTLLVPFALLGVAGWLEAQPQAPKLDPKAKIEQVSVAGTFNSWNLNALPMISNSDGVWAANFQSTMPGEIEFKFVVNRDWRSNLGDIDQTEAGLPASGTAELDDGNNSTSNIRVYIPRKGTYVVTIDTSTLAYEVRAADADDKPMKPQE